MDDVDGAAKKAAQHLRALLRGGDVEFLALLDQRAHPIGARAAGDGASDARDDFLEPFQRHRARVDLRASRRLFGQRGNVHVAEVSQDESARNRRRGHHQKIGGLALARQGETLAHAKAMLFVDDGEAEIAKRDALLKQRVCADRDVDFASDKRGKRRASLGRFITAGDDGDAQARRFGQRLHARVVLARQNFSRRHQCRLPSGLDDIGHRQQRDDGLARADIALQQPQHALGRGEIGADIGERSCLRSGQAERQRRDDCRAVAPRADAGAPGQHAHPRPHQQQRQLIGEQLVEGEAHARRAFGRNILGPPRIVHGAKRLGEARRAQALERSGVDPFRQAGNACKRAQRRAMQNAGE